MQQELFKIEPKKIRASAELAAWWFDVMKKKLKEKQNKK
tara:strand:+ start:471 stop:587 length:117 start_codon:yes stop_codon:yes gene_type:complete